jgi:hypothetical protein
MEGEIYSSGKLKNGKISLSLNLPPGLYICVFNSGKEVVGNGKFVIIE